MALTLLGVILAVGLQGEPPDAPPAPVQAGVPRDARMGVIFALIAAAGYGMAFWVLGYHVTGQLGGTAPVWVVRLVTIATLAALAAPLRQNLRVPRAAGLWGPITVVGLLDTGGYVAFAHAMHGDQIAIVGVLSSLFSAVTVLLSWIVLRERLAVSQWLGIVVIFAGVALVSA
jgi:drug/metabolite transporter (DMT)-like permease